MIKQEQLTKENKMNIIIPTLQGMKNKIAKESRMTKRIYALLGVLTAIIGYEMHGNWFYTIMDFLFWFLVWIKWLIFHEITLGIITKAFAFFFV